MKRLLLALCALLIASPAFAGTNMLMGAGKPPGGGGGGYVGPGDLFGSAKGWWGLRAYSAATAAAQVNAVKLNRSADAEKCILTVTTTGDLATVTSGCSGASSGTAATTWCAASAGSCTVDTFYDQSGNGFNAFSTTPPAFVFACQNGKPCIQGDGTTGLEAYTITTTTAQALTMSAVAIRTSGTSQSNLMASLGAGTLGVYMKAANQVTGYFGNEPATSGNGTDNAWHAMQFTVNSTSSAINVDGTDATGLDFGTGALPADVYLGRGPSGQGLIGKYAEFGLWPAGANATQRGNLCHNQFSYWATAASC